MRNLLVNDVKFGEPFEMATPSQAQQWEGVETEQHPSKVTAL
jgi:hypothetical protein